LLYKIIDLEEGVKQIIVESTIRPVSLAAGLNSLILSALENGAVTVQVISLIT
jgi:hypothetical protein